MDGWKIRPTEGRVSCRKGFSLLEVVAAGVLLLVLLAVSLQFFTASVHQRRAMRARQIAVEEAANVMERLSAQGWDELTSPTAAALALSPEACQGLKNGILDVQIAQPPGEPEAKRIAVEIRWTMRTDVPQNVRLVGWRYRTKP